MNKKELELRRHIYGTTNVIVVDTIDCNMLEQIELIRSSMQLDGFIFRPTFANDTELKEYTDEDWEAMLAQYAITYEWQSEYQEYFEKNPINVLNNYFENNTEPVIDVSKVNNSGDVDFKVKDRNYYFDVLTDIAKSKTVLRDQQLKILELMPIKYIEQVYLSTDITIKETEIQFMRRLVEQKSSFKFTDTDQIVRFVVAVYRTNGEPVVGQLNNTILKDVKIKMPTSVKKKILSDIDTMKHFNALKNMDKYKNFWKRLFKQLAWTSEEKLRKRYPNAMKIKKQLFNGTYIKKNTKLEMFKTDGNLEDALKEEMKNPGQMLRNLLFYLRYKEGDRFAKKQKKQPSDFSVGNYFAEKNDKKTNNHIVIKDAKNVLKSNEFYETLKKTNTKLLWQVLTMLRDNRLFVPMNERHVNGVRIRYSIPVPGLEEELVKIAKKQIKNAIKEIKRKENESLGLVYVSNDIKNYAMQFSGRTDTSMSMSGEYLPSGSIIDISEIIPKQERKNKLLRVGLAWRGRSSCDIDLSMNIKGYGAIYYGNPTLSKGNDIIMTSSGDITSCRNDMFSTELIDVDIDLFMKHGFTEMFNSAIMFSGRDFNNYEAYWFVSVINREDRIVNRQKITINLDEMDYAVQIMEEAKGMCGLKFTLTENKQEIEVLNIPMKNVQNGMNAKYAERQFENAIASRPKIATLEKAIKLAINKQQIVEDIEFADVVISKTEPEAIKIINDNGEVVEEKNQTWYHPGRDMIKLQEILF
jgi:hypothetical protein